MTISELQNRKKMAHTFKPFLSKIGEKMINYKNWYYLLSSLMIISQFTLFFTIRSVFEYINDESNDIVDLIFMFSFFFICINTLIVMLLFFTFFCTGAAIYSELRGYEILKISKTTLGEPSNEYFKLQLEEIKN